MTPVRERPDWSHIPILLSDPQIAQPYQVVDAFFGDYGLGEFRQALQKMVVTCLTTENVDFATPEQRSTLLTRIDRLVETLEAIYLIVQGKRTDGLFNAN